MSGFDVEAAMLVCVMEHYCGVSSFPNFGINFEGVEVVFEGSSKVIKVGS